MRQSANTILPVNPGREANAPFPTTTTKPIHYPIKREKKLSLTIHVSKTDGDFSTIQEAINAVPYEETATIHISEGVYNEKIFCEKRAITLIGDGVDKTILCFDDYANEVMEDGSKRGTFRSYTAFFGGDRVHIKDMTIRNDAGDGRAVGQAIAVYADADICFFENVKMTGCQDTLFCAPLPRQERKKNGFLGPRVMTERRLTSQYYKNCTITGDVDFIFGGADAVFDDCTIICNDRMHVGLTVAGSSPAGSATLDKDQIDTRERFINGYITAACGLSRDLGFVFRNCRIGGAEGCEEGSVFLGRPWRDEAKSVFLHCTMDKTIAPERFSGWGGITVDQPETFYGEFGTILAGPSIIFADLSQKNSWVKDISESEAAAISSRADLIVKRICG